MRRLLSHRAFFATIGWLWALAAPAQSLPAPTEQMHYHLSRILHMETAIDLDRVPGLVLLLIDGDSTWLDQWGSQRMDTLVPFTDSTVFEMGAVSMIATAALVCLAAEDGFALDSTVWHFLPDSLRLPVLRKLTIRDLLVHRTGLPRQPDMDGRLDAPDEAPFASYTWGDLRRWLARLDRPSKKEWSFSYVNYALLQLALENHYGQPIDYIFAKKIGEPLGLRETGYAWPRSIALQLAPPHNRGGRIVAPWQFASFKGALAWKTSARDLAIFVRWLMEDPRCKPIFTPAVKVPYRKGVEATAGGHATFPRKHILVVSQSGATDGHSAYIAMAPDYGKAVVVLANSAIGLGKFGYLSLRYLMRGWKRTPRR